ncbi:MAG: hypothetical protein M3Z24_02295 [Chloroflexota bacterium]|nr:hypothetical protein [Chloroflexota bacterium]
MANNVKRASEYAQRILRQSQQKNTTLLLQTITAILAACTLGSTLLLFASCSTQNLNVNPSPAIWKIVHSENPGSAQNSLNAIAATSIKDAWAVGTFSASHFGSQGSKALIEHWNGSAWSVFNSPDTPLGNSILNGVAAISPTNAWAVGYAFNESNNSEQHTLIEHWNGTSWAIVASPTPINGGQLSAITALSATNIWAVGYGDNLGRTLIEHWNGNVWAVVQSPNPGSGENLLTGLTAISMNDIWAVGIFSNGIRTIATGEGLVEHWNGTSWSVVQSSNPGMQGNFLSSIAAISTNDVWAIGSSSQGTKTLIEHWNGTSWRTVASPNPGTAENTLSSVVTISTHSIWAVGSAGSTFAGQQSQPVIEHWDGTSWSTFTSPNIGTINTSLSGAGLVPHSTNIWAVGTGFYYANPVSVSSPNATQTSNETPITAQTLIEFCCS